jgi:hypothetical protein
MNSIKYLLSSAIGIGALVVSFQGGAAPPTTNGAQPSAATSVPSPSAGADDPPLPPISTIQGLVRDIACAVENPKAEARDFNLPCAKACALAGSPLIVQTDDGILYIPISNTIPDTDQRPRLMQFVGKYVQVRGRIYERRGTRAITLEGIKELPNVHLKTE